MNLILASRILKFLALNGAKDFIVCAGARNAPLVKLLGRSSGSQNLHFFDERAAGFFALGRARRDQCPVVVITTSGTAVAELLPSAIEAFYSGVPLVFLTADRPKTYRGSAAPQAIEQVGIFSHYAQECFDIDNVADIADLKLSKDGPTHINLCFSEPLIDETIPELVLSTGEWNGETTKAPTDESVYNDFFLRAKKPLVVLGTIAKKHRSAIYESLIGLSAPIYAEAPSGLRECEGLSHLLLSGGSELLNAKTVSNNFDSIIRIGSVPTLRLWRDLEDTLITMPVLSVSDLSFSGLAREKNASIPYSLWLQLSAKFNYSHGSELRAKYEVFSRQKEKLLTEYLRSEPAAFRWLSEIIPQHAQIFLGNSLPIREWDLAACNQEKEFNVIANRGANGIDGLISTYLGAAKNNCENWIILGDLSALYDLNALAFTKFADSRDLRLVIINNGGGQIFDRMFHDKDFINSHKIEFSKWAEMFGWEYLKITEPSRLSLKACPTVIEICPSSLETEKFWASYEGIIK